jgi:hypothetical protein
MAIHGRAVVDKHSPTTVERGDVKLTATASCATFQLSSTSTGS